MRLLTLILLLTLSAFASPSATMGQGRISHTDMGGESVTKIMKTADGLILLGTDNGIVLYDGHEMTRIEISDCKRPFNFVNDMARIKDKRILAAMRNGLYEVDLTNGKCQHLAAPITEAMSIICDGKGRIWVACKQGLALLNHNMSAVESMIKADASNVTSTDNRLACAAEDGEGHIWMANDRGLLYRHDTNSGRTTRVTAADSLISSPIVCLKALGDRLYIGTLNSGLIQIDIDKWTARKIGGLPSSIKQLVAVKDALYICTDGGGAYILTDSDLSQCHTTDNAVYSCYTDPETATEWYGYYQNGFSRTTAAPSPFSTYSHGSFDTRGIHVRSFCKRGSELVVGTRQGVYFINEARGTVYHLTPEVLGCAIITDIKYFADQYVFTSYERGVYGLDPQTMRVAPLPVPQPYRESSCNSLIVSPDSGTLYVGSSRGLLILDERLHVSAAYDYRHSDMLGNYIYDMLLDKGGKLWISTAKGMCIYNTRTGQFQTDGFPDGFWHYVPNLTFAFSHSNDILAASEQSLFFSHSNLSSHKELRLMQRLGLGQIDFISAVDSIYLIGTDKGLFVFDSTLTSFCQYSEADGLPSARFARCDCFINDDGEVWMATSKGLVHANLATLSAPATSPSAKVFISSYTLGDREKSTRKAKRLTTDGKGGEPKYGIDVSWHFTSATLSITPTLLDYNSHGEGRYYEWQIDGSDEDVAYESHPILLNNLGIGNHTLTIQQAGRPSTAVKVVVSVRPSAICYIELLLLSLLIVLAAMAHRLRRRRRLYSELTRQKHKMELELTSALAVSRHKQEEEEQRELFNQEKQKEREELARQRSASYKLIHENVEKYMREKQPYLDANLRLPDLAMHAGTNAATLSQMFNDYLQTSYFDYVNRYRIEHFKRIALDPANNQLTLTALSEMCGFKHSSFFNVFKKMEGCTPNEWMKAMKA